MSSAVAAARSAAGAGFTATIDNVLSGSGELIKTDQGTLVLNGANTYSGGTLLSEGTLAISSDANLGVASGMLGFDRGTLATTADIVTARAIGILNEASFVPSSGTTLELDGPISGVGGLIGSALAVDMTGAEIKAFLSGKTVYLESTAASASGTPGQSVIYWAEDGTALFKTPTGAIMHGTWEVKGNTNCSVWKERPNTACVRYDKTGDAISAIDAVSGQVRAKVLKTAPGNAEKLAP